MGKNQKYSWKMYSAWKYEKEMDRKLKFGYATVTSSEFDAGKHANIDLSIVGEASILYDLTSGED